VHAGVRARGGELRPGLLQRRRVVERNGARAGHDAEQLREREIRAGHRGELFADARGIRARRNRELRDGNVELAGPAAGDVQKHVHALRGHAGWSTERQ
jgi:hypothetical protein